MQTAKTPQIDDTSTAVINYNFQFSHLDTLKACGKRRIISVVRQCYKNFMVLIES